LTYSSVTLSDLLDAGLLAPNTVVVWRRQKPRKGLMHKAKVTASGRIQMANGETYPTPSAAARDLNDGRPINGWLAWKVGDAAGPSLAEVRKQLQR
jgi:RAMA domain-containing protein